MGNRERICSRKSCGVTAEMSHFNLQRINISQSWKVTNIKCKYAYVSGTRTFSLSSSRGLSVENNCKNLRRNVYLYYIYIYILNLRINVYLYYIYMYMYMYIYIYIYKLPQHNIINLVQKQGKNISVGTHRKQYKALRSLMMKAPKQWRPHAATELLNDKT